jgi:Fe-S cluster biogenesis protein NfuA
LPEPGQFTGLGGGAYNKIHEEAAMKEKVQKVLDTIRPTLQADGGDVELVEITPEGVVRVRLQGACGSCPMSTMTLKMGIEKALKNQIPEVKEVERVD